MTAVLHPVLHLLPQICSSPPACMHVFLLCVALQARSLLQVAQIQQQHLQSISSNLPQHLPSSCSAQVMAQASIIPTAKATTAAAGVRGLAATAAASNTCKADGRGVYGAADHVNSLCSTCHWQWHRRTSCTPAACLLRHSGRCCDAQTCSTNSRALLVCR